MCDSLYHDQHSVNIRIYFFWFLEDERWHTRKNSLYISLWNLNIAKCCSSLQNTPITCSVFPTHSFHARDRVTTAWFFRHFASRNVNRQLNQVRTSTLWCCIDFISGSKSQLQLILRNITRTCVFLRISGLLNQPVYSLFFLGLKLY